MKDATSNMRPCPIGIGRGSMGWDETGWGIGGKGVRRSSPVVAEPQLGCRLAP